MSDYVLSYTLSGQSETTGFDQYRWAAAAFRGLTRNPYCTAATLHAGGYEVERYVRDACTTCGGQGETWAGVWVRGEVVSERHVCSTCDGRGWVQGDYDWPHEPEAAGREACPDCTPLVYGPHPPMTADQEAALDEAIASIPF